MITQAAYIAFVVVVVILIIAGAYFRRRRFLRRYHERQQEEMQLETDSAGRTYYTNTVRMPGAVVIRLERVQNEEDKPEDLPPYQPPQKPLNQPPAYSENASDARAA
ncbi:hypothetical protein IW150_006681, partial [Coemansia sp. RSA 2607]